MNGQPKKSFEEGRILLVDDDDVFRTRLGKALRSRGLFCEEAASGEQALVLAQTTQFTKVILDLRMPGIGGLAALDKLQALLPNAKILILTGYATIATSVDALKRGAYHFLPKPAHADEILAAFDEEQATEASEKSPLPTPSLEQVEWEHLQRVLQDNDGNVSLAAKALGMHRRSLQRKLAKMPGKLE